MATEKIIIKTMVYIDAELLRNVRTIVKLQN